jgi:hypothetical protein
MSAQELLNRITEAVQRQQKLHRWWTVTIMLTENGATRKWAAVERIEADDQHTATAIALSRHIDDMPLKEWDDMGVICERTSPSERPS